MPRTEKSRFFDVEFNCSMIAGKCGLWFVGPVIELISLHRRRRRITGAFVCICLLSNKKMSRDATPREF